MVSEDTKNLVSLPETHGSARQDDVVVSAVDNEKLLMDRITIFFHVTVVILFLLLLVSPVFVSQLNNGGETTLTGLRYVGAVSFENTHLQVLAIGWMGLLVGCISWFWFIGYIAIAVRVKQGLSSIFSSALVVFFLWCFFGVKIVFEVGKGEPGDISGSSSAIIQQFLSGYYIYQLLVVYLMILSLLYLKQVPLKVKLILTKIISIIILLFAVFFTITLNPHLNKVIATDLNARQIASEQYLEQFERESREQVAYNTSLVGLFSPASLGSLGIDSNWSRLSVRCPIDGSAICGKDVLKLVFLHGYFLHDLNTDIKSSVVKTLENHFTLLVPKIIEIRRVHFGESLHGNNMLFSVIVESYSDASNTYTITCEYLEQRVKCK